MDAADDAVLSPDAAAAEEDAAFCDIYFTHLLYIVLSGFYPA